MLYVLPHALRPYLWLHINQSLTLLLQKRVSPAVIVHWFFLCSYWCLLFPHRVLHTVLLEAHIIIGEFKSRMLFFTLLLILQILHLLWFYMICRIACNAFAMGQVCKQPACCWCGQSGLSLPKQLLSNGYFIQRFALARNSVQPYALLTCSLQHLAPSSNQQDSADSCG